MLKVGDVLAGPRVDRADQAVVEEHQPPVGAVGALPVVDPAPADPPGGLALPEFSRPVAGSSAAILPSPASTYIIPLATSG